MEVSLDFIRMILCDHLSKSIVCSCYVSGSAQRANWANWVFYFIRIYLCQYSKSLIILSLIFLLSTCIFIFIKEVCSFMFLFSFISNFEHYVRSIGSILTLCSYDFIWSFEQTYSMFFLCFWECPKSILIAVCDEFER